MFKVNNKFKGKLRLRSKVVNTKPIDIEIGKSHTFKDEKSIESYKETINSYALAGLVSVDETEKKDSNESKKTKPANTSKPTTDDNGNEQPPSAPVKETPAAAPRKRRRRTAKDKK